MKKQFLKATLFLAFLGGPITLMAQDDWSKIDLTDAVSNDTLVTDGYTLVFIIKKLDFSPITRQKMIDAFFTVYPQEVKMYNPKASKKAVFVVDPAYTGVAAASSGIIRFNPEWFAKNPEDIDVVTHECMHLVQNYKDFEPGWITEGIADYVRATMGVNNEAGGWKMPEFKPTHSYKNAYRITARFFVWIEKNKKQGLVVNLNEAMRNGKYKDSFWKKQTGLTVDELWDQYSKNPQI